MSVEAKAGWNLDRLDHWSEPVEFEVTQERIMQYAAATNDEHPAHRSGELAPPVFAIVPAFQALAQTAVGIVPPELFMRVVHGEQDFRYHRPILPEQVLTTTAAPVGVHGASTGVVVISKGRTTSSDGELVVEQYMTSFFRGAQLDVHEGEPVTEHKFDEPLRGHEPLASIEHRYDSDQTRRYSEAAGDPMPIHLDDELAKSMGLPGIIVHGLCTMAFCSRAVIQTACPDDPTRLKRLAARFSKIVQPHETVTHALYEARHSGEARRIAFETTTDTGKVAIKDGLAEIANA
ncbi:MAG TPA: MaoC/PaaZ C-terminal domain-containing protein [Solirubrobacteraceae bacterium]|nr:MaoC/PaaZ C-terminal domain-containing protein [Solirubrobacteraceae bacterium]